MRSRLDTMTRLVAQAAAVVLFVLIWISAEKFRAQPPVPADPVPEVMSGQPAEAGGGTESTPLPLVWNEPPSQTAKGESKTESGPQPEPGPQPEAVALAVDDEALAAMSVTVSSPAPNTEAGSPVESNSSPVAGPPAAPNDGTAAVQTESDDNDMATAQPAPEPEAQPGDGETSEPAAAAGIDGEYSGAAVFPKATSTTTDTPTEAEPVGESPGDAVFPGSISTTTNAPTEAEPVGESPGDTVFPEATGATGDTPAEQAEDPAVSPISDKPAGFAPAQPDETGFLAVAEEDAGGEEDAILPLSGDRGLEILGEGVFWAGLESDLSGKKELLPPDARAVFLVPAPDAPLPDAGGLPAETVPAGDDALGAGGAERFLRAVRTGPTVVATLPGAWSEAFFKGAYLIVMRGAEIDAALAEIGPELERAGDRRDVVIQSLRGLDADALKRSVFP